MSRADQAQSAARLDDVSVVVLSYNRKEELLINLPALCEASREMGFELIIVDNASTDGSREFLAELASTHPDLVVLLNDTNTGVAEGRNTGWRAARGTYVLQIDDDTRIDVDGVRALRDFLAQNEETGAVSPRILHAQTLKAQCDHGASPCVIGNYHGACHMVTRKAHTEVGEIDPLCLFGGEELDYSIRMRSHNYVVSYTPNVLVYHNSYIRKNDSGMWRRQMRVYNYTRIYFKHFSIHRAFILSFRYLLAHVISGARTHGLLFPLSLPANAIRGGIDGKRQHEAVPRHVEMFYSEHALRPDVGNVPLVRKFFRKLLR